MSQFRLAIDVGNSRIKFGLFREVVGKHTPCELPECLNSISGEHGDEIPWSEIQSWVERESRCEIRGVIGGGHPDSIARVQETWPTDFGASPLLVQDRDKLPLKSEVDFPNKVGIDRLLNAVAVNVFRPADTIAVVVDSGTATTVDLISADGSFQGGAILPGFDLLARALHEYTALLPLVSMDDLASQTCDPVGKNTLDAIRSGQVWGQLGSVKELIDRITAVSSDSSDNALLILTGGGAPLLAPHLQQARHEPFLALQGLVLAAAHLEQEGRAL